MDERKKSRIYAAERGLWEESRGKQEEDIESKSNFQRIVITSLETTIQQNQWKWLGHIIRMGNKRVAKKYLK